MPSARHTILSETATYDEEGDLRVVIETPKGSRNKYGGRRRSRKSKKAAESRHEGFCREKKNGDAP